MNTINCATAPTLSAIPRIVTRRHLGSKSPWWWIIGGGLLIIMLAVLSAFTLPTPIANSPSFPTLADPSSFPPELPLSVNFDAMLSPSLPMPTGPTREEVDADCEKTHAAMKEAAAWRLRELEQFFEALQNDSDAQATFAEALLGLEAKSLYVTGQGYETWCEGQFRSLILEPETLAEASHSAFKGLCLDLERIRSEQYFRLGLDDELEPSALGHSTDMNVMRMYVSAIARRMANSAVKDIPESVARVGLSFVAGEAARAATESLAGSSPEAGWLALGVEILAGLGADAALEQLSDPTGRLVTELKDTLGELKARIMENGSESNSLEVQMNAIVESHYAAQRQALAEKLNLPLLLAAPATGE